MIPKWLFGAVLMMMVACLGRAIHLRNPKEKPKSVYAVVIDAGSTGSRILAQQFHKSTDGRLEMSECLFETNEQGLSEFADSPKKGARMILSLLKKAKHFVPKRAWKTTPIILRATAGLRLLPKQKAASLLQQVRDTCSKRPFKNPSVDILKGSDEGIFGWISVNLLLEKLYNAPSEMVSTMELGGASTQLTYPLVDGTDLTQFPAGDVHSITIAENKINLYTHSYLSLGKYAARHGILSLGNPEGAKTLVSDCISPIHNGKTFKFAGTTYTVKSSYESESKKSDGSDSGSMVDNCARLVEQFISSHQFKKPEGVLNFEPVLFSEFYGVAVEAKLIEQLSTVPIEVKEIRVAAEAKCQIKPLEAEHPFLCVDLLFIHTLLTNGYGFNPETSVKFVKKLQGREVNWALGAAYISLDDKLSIESLS